MPFSPRAFLDAGPMRVPLLLPMELILEIPLAELISSLSKLRLFLALEAILSLVIQDKAIKRSKFWKINIYWIQNYILGHSEKQ